MDSNGCHVTTRACGISFASSRFVRFSIDAIDIGKRSNIDIKISNNRLRVEVTGMKMQFYS